MARSNATRGGASDWRDSNFDDNYLFAGARRGGRDRKTAQLCAQALRTLGGAIATGLGDPRLGDLFVIEVRPHPNASHLLVVIGAGPGTDLQLANALLRDASAHLRQELAPALSRKRVPTLAFVVLPEGGDHEG